MQFRIPLNSLNAFVTAAHLLSFQKAAESLYVTPSAVSHQVRNLEKLLGYQLFDRLDKQIRLTARGEKLFADAWGPMQQLHEAGRRALRGLADNTLSLSVAPVFATRWLLPRLKDFHTTYPEISLNVIASTELVDFAEDQFDASIRMGKGRWHNTTAMRLFQVQLVAVCHPKLLKANGGLLTTAQLEDFPLVQNASMAGAWDRWFESQAGAHAAPKFGLTVQNSAQVVEALQSGDSIGLVDKRFIQEDVDSGRLAIACEYIYADADGYYLTFPKSAESLPSLQSFRNWLFSQPGIDPS